MMGRDRIKRLYDLHSWTGIVTACLVFVVVFSGIPALFDQELKAWEDSSNRIALSDDPVELLPLIENFIQDVTGNNETVQSIVTLLPTQAHPVYQVELRLEDAESGTRHEALRKWDPNTGRIIPLRGEGFSSWLTGFHRNFMIEGTVGRALVGLVGIFLLISTVTGILTHRKMFVEMFTWRLDRSVRLKWQDTHKIIGFWGVPYVLMIAFTGAFLGLLVVMLPATAILVFKGDRDAILEAVTGPPVERVGVTAVMQPILPLVERVEDVVQERPERLIIQRWGDQSAHYSFLYKIEGKLLRFGQYVINGGTGEFVEHRLTEGPGAAWRVVSAITPLHYATYGGIWLKGLYSVLAAGLCIVIGTGSMMWLERRKHGYEGQRSAMFYRYLGHLTTGLMTGIIVASTALFHVDAFLLVNHETRLFWIGVCYFSLWVLVIGFTFSRGNDYKACRETLILSGFLLLAAPVTNAIAKGGALFLAPSGLQSYVLGVDIAVFVLGALCIAISRRLPTHRAPFGE